MFDLGLNSLFSPLRRKDEPVTFFIKQLCSPMILNYKRIGSYRGVGLHVFTKEFEDFATNNLSCFCRQPTECPIRGTMDMLPCMQVPITISLPHFLHADPRLLDNVASGLCPIEYKHEFFLAVQMVSNSYSITRVEIEIFDSIYVFLILIHSLLAYL